MLCLCGCWCLTCSHGMRSNTWRMSSIRTVACVCVCVYAVCNNIHIHVHRTTEQFIRNIQFVMHAAYLLNCCCVCNPACSLLEIQSVACGFCAQFVWSDRRCVMCVGVLRAGEVEMGVHQKMRWITKEREHIERAEAKPQSVVHKTHSELISSVGYW